MFGVAHAFGLDRTEPEVTFTLLSITHQPSLVDDPVTLSSRTVRRRGTDYTRLSAVFALVADITQGEVSLEEAYRRLAEMRRNRHPYTKWALTVASGALSGAASLLVGGDGLVFVLAAFGAMLGDRLAWLCAGRGLPEFYQFAAAAMPPAGMGVAVALLAQHTDTRIQASAVITGGLFALIPGRALVAAVHDGLTGFYITAAARLLEVIYLIVGIVCGVLMVLYVGARLNARLTPDIVHHSDRPVTQLLAAMLLALAFCVLLQQERHTVVLATMNGGVAWLIFGVLTKADVTPVPATVVAAGLVGLFGQLLSRYQFASSLPYITAAIGPLLPGSNTYFGLLNIAQGDVNKGFEHLATAGALALAIAIGVNLGGESWPASSSRPRARRRRCRAGAPPSAPGASERRRGCPVRGQPLRHPNGGSGAAPCRNGSQCPPSAASRLMEASTSASASARPTQSAPSTDLPGSRSL